MRRSTALTARCIRWIRKCRKWTPSLMRSCRRSAINLLRTQKKKRNKKLWRLLLSQNLVETRKLPYMIEIRSGRRWPIPIQGLITSWLRAYVLTSTCTISTKAVIFVLCSECTLTIGRTSTVEGHRGFKEIPWGTSSFRKDFLYKRSSAILLRRLFVSASNLTL